MFKKLKEKYVVVKREDIEKIYSACEIMEDSRKRLINVIINENLYFKDESIDETCIAGWGAFIAAVQTLIRYMG